MLIQENNGDLPLPAAPNSNDVLTRLAASASKHMRKFTKNLSMTRNDISKSLTRIARRKSKNDVSETTGESKYLFSTYFNQTLFLKFIIRPFILGRINFKWFWIATTMRNINPGNKSLKFSQYSLDYSSLHSIYCSSEEIFSQESKYRIPYQYQNSYHEQDYTTVFLILSPQI